MMLTTHRKITHIFVFALALWLLSTCLAFSAHQAASHVAEPPDVIVGPTVVKVGIWVIDIDSIDSAAQSFVSNFFVKLSWQDKRLAHEDQSVRIFDLDDVWSPGLQIVNEIGRVRKTLPEIVQVKNDETVIYRQRYVGSFSQPLQLQDFPFDEQLFWIYLVRTSKVDKLVEFTQDDELIAAGMVQAAGISKDISLPDWAVKSYTAGPLTYEITSSMKVSGYAFDFYCQSRFKILHLQSHHAIGADRYDVLGRLLDQPQGSRDPNRYFHGFDVDLDRLSLYGGPSGPQGLVHDQTRRVYPRQG